MAVVLLAAEARADFDRLPLTIQVRVRAVFVRIKHRSEVYDD